MHQRMLNIKILLVMKDSDLFFAVRGRGLGVLVSFTIRRVGAFRRDGDGGEVDRRCRFGIAIDLKWRSSSGHGYVRKRMRCTSGRCCDGVE